MHSRAVEQKTYEEERFRRNPYSIVVVAVVTRGKVAVRFKMNAADEDDDLKDQSNNGKDGSNSTNAQFPETIALFSFLLSESHCRRWDFWLGGLHLTAGSDERK